MDLRRHVRFIAVAASGLLTLQCASARDARPTDDPVASGPSTAIAEPEGRFATVNGHRLWYRVSGQGPPVVLIPGGPGLSHTLFYPAFERLTDVARVVYFDPFGRGQSDRASTPSQYSFRGDVEDLEGLRQALGFDRVSVYGISYGGIVAQAYALRYPSSLSKLILADTLYSAEAWQNGFDHVNTQIRDQFPDVWAELQALRAKGAVTCDPDYLKALGPVPFGLSYLYDPTAALPRFEQNLEVMCQILGSDATNVVGRDLESFDVEQQVRDIAAPALVLAGRFDRVAMPRYTLRYRTLMPQAEVVLFEQSGHFVFVEEPEHHDDVVRAFLKK